MMTKKTIIIILLVLWLFIISNNRTESFDEGNDFNNTFTNFPNLMYDGPFDIKLNDIENSRICAQQCKDASIDCLAADYDIDDKKCYLYGPENMSMTNLRHKKGWRRMCRDDKMLRDCVAEPYISFYPRFNVRTKGGDKFLDSEVIPGMSVLSCGRKCEESPKCRMFEIEKDGDRRCVLYSDPIDRTSRFIVSNSRWDRWCKKGDRFC